jgi:DNA-binding transcriptional MerR regulator
VSNETAGCSSTAAPSTALKAMFRDIARAVHPDAAPAGLTDERTRYRRHSLMAEANRAYSERDEDRLRLILSAWKLDEDAAVCADPDAERARLQRRAAALTERLTALDAAFDDLRSSAIAKLKRRIDEARTQGWDLFAEMVRQIKREIDTARVKLKRLRRQHPPT